MEIGSLERGRQVTQTAIRPSVARCKHNLTFGEPTPEEIAQGLGREVCLLCGQVNLINTEGKVVRTIHDASLVDPLAKNCRRDYSHEQHTAEKTPGKEPPAVSRQRKWQLNMRPKGLCVICGQPAGGYQHCIEHRRCAVCGTPSHGSRYCKKHRKGKTDES